MAIHLKRTLIIFAILMAIVQASKGQDEPPPAETEEDDFSSEETQEESNESSKRRRRSPDSAAEGTDSNFGQAKAGLPAIPGLPDPETILKIAELLTTVGQQVLPVLVSGNSGVNDIVSNRKMHDMKFLKKFKNELDSLSGELKKIL